MSTEVTTITPESKNKQSFFKWLRTLWFTWDGRLNRIDYFFGRVTTVVIPFIGSVICFIMVSVLRVVPTSLLPALSILAVVLTVPVVAYICIGALVATFTLSIRRFHDFNFSGWWSLLLLIPWLGFLLGLILCFIPGSKQDNKYGSMPR